MKPSVFKKHAATVQIDKHLLDHVEPAKTVQNGDFVIAVMDRGWVFVGFATLLPNQEIRLDCAHCVHKWGTTKGLGEIAIGGPTSNTELFAAGTIYGKPIFIIAADIEKW